MNEACHALISLEERFAEAILDGVKRVEFRRRPMRVRVGTTIWMYAKVPVGEVVGSARVQALIRLTPTTLWGRYGEVSGLSKDEFFHYFSGIENGFALLLANPIRLASPFSLNTLRALRAGFHPPQFFQHLASDGAFVSAFTGGVAAADTLLLRHMERQPGCAFST